MTDLNIIIVGVGGQGTLLASRVLGNLALKVGSDVKVSEVHGMSQRGGSVITYVKFGKQVYSPLIEKGEADLILAFERLEALRWVDFLKTNGKLIVNDQRIDPMPVITGKAKYPESIIERLQERIPDTIRVDALNIAKECGNNKAVNVVLLGIAAKTIAVEKEIWLETIREVAPPKALEVNLKAFEAGYNIS